MSRNDGSHHDRDSTSTDKYQNLENPPMERAPSPPTSSAKSSVRHGSSTLNFSKQVGGRWKIYSKHEKFLSFIFYVYVNLTFYRVRITSEREATINRQPVRQYTAATTADFQMKIFHPSITRTMIYRKKCQSGLCYFIDLNYYIV